MIEIDFKIQTPSGTFDANNFQWVETYIKSIEEKLKSSLTEKDLTAIANIIKKDIVRNRIGGVDIFGGSYHPRKKRNNPPLFDTGQLRNSVEIKSSTNQREIFIGGSRKQIASYLQYGTKRMKPFPFFGISEQAEREIENYLKDKKI